MNCKTVNQFHILVYYLSYNKYLTLTLFLHSEKESKDDQGFIFFRTSCGNINDCQDFCLDNGDFLHYVITIFVHSGYTTTFWNTGLEFSPCARNFPPVIKSAYRKYRVRTKDIIAGSVFLCLFSCTRNSSSDYVTYWEGPSVCPYPTFFKCGHGWLGCSGGSKDIKLKMTFCLIQLKYKCIWLEPS